MNLIINRCDLPYTTIPNVILRNEKRLSWKAKGLFAFLLSCPPGWKIQMRDLVARAADGKAAIYSGFDELEKAGYIRRTQSQGADGRFGPTIINVRLTPCTDFPHTEKPETEKPETENRTLNKQDPDLLDLNKPEKEIEPETPLLTPQPGDFDYITQNIQRVWNEMAEGSGLPKATKIGKYRLAAIRMFAREYPDFLQWWKPAIMGIPSVPWLINGRNGWRVDIDWFLKANNPQRVWGWVQSAAKSAPQTVPKDWKI